MNKKLSKILSCGVCLTMATVFTAGCAKSATTGPGGDPETRPFVMAIGATDGNFSPFFATAQYDVQVTELTQISMLGSDEGGNVVCGKYEPTAVLDYKTTFYADRDCKIEVDENNSSMDGATVYEFVIKNGIKFSNGSDLTIKDVLFNLYVYLDPVYFGSSTIYSTDIQGLTAYRTQDPTAEDYSDISATFDAVAQSKIYDLMQYLKEGELNGNPESEYKAQIEQLKELYLEEVTSDWTSCYGTKDSYEKEYRFNSNWEIYYFNEGLVSVKYLTNDKGNREAMKDSQGRYMTNLDDCDGDGYPDSDYREKMEEALADEDKISAAMTKYQCTREEALEYVERDFAIETVYDSKTSTNLTLYSIFTEGWATASELRDKFAKQAMSQHFEESRKDDGSLEVPTVSGITTYKTSTFNGKNGEVLSGSHDVLRVVINGVDPKAIWNMAFQVAPAYYYSGKYKGVDYRNIDIDKNQFGVCFGDSEFFDSVLGDTDKSKLPVGAGAYQASTANGGTTDNGDRFHNNKVSYYIRNEYFETVGADGTAKSGKTAITNAKIKYVRYREVETANLMNTLKTGEVDYGEPNCTTNNIRALEDGAKVTLGYTTPISSGYGYVGINPKYIPDKEVRAAIMSAMDINRAVSYYGRDYASAIYRPMSTANWVHKDYLAEREADLKKPAHYYPYEEDEGKIWDKLSAAGWRKVNGVGEKNGRRLKYTFTIAGGTEDHPAYNMFQNAANILNNAGFEITVVTSTDALKSLATGALAVWAAAYTSPIDPDLYQLYHKDSKATNVKNWGYDSIKSNQDHLYDYELGKLNSLSTLIMKARQSTDPDIRGPIYVDALDLIMDLAIQLPTYQRKDLVVYNRGLLDTTTLNTGATAYAGVLNRIWEVDYKKA